MTSRLRENGSKSLVTKVRRPSVLLSALVVVVLVAVAGYTVVRTSRAAAIVGDLNGDGTVNVFDLSILLSDWNTTTAVADLNGDGMVNIFDLSMLLSHWGQTAPSPSATATPTPTTTPTPAYCSSGGSQLWSNLHTCGWPDATNTGPDLSQCPGGTLTNNSGSLTRSIVISTANTTISCENITGQLDIRATGVTIKNSVVSGSSGKTGTNANGTSVIYVEDGASATVDHVQVNGNNAEHACIWHQGTSLSVTAVNCFEVDDGIFSWADTGYSSTTGDHFTIKDSYIHNLTTLTANGHEDGYQTEGAANGLIQHNTFQETTTADSAVAIWDSLKSSHDITVSDNLMTGGGFTVYAEDYDPNISGPGNGQGGFSETQIHFTNNSFSTFASGCVGDFGVWFYRATWTPYFGGPTDFWNQGGSSRSGNKVLETGENVDNGNPHSGGSLCS